MISYHQGDSAGRAGLDHSANPYAVETTDHDCWINGWQHGRWIWAQKDASRSETITCPTCKAEGERVFVTGGQEVWNPDGYVQSDSGRDEYDPPGEGAESMTCDGCHTSFEHRMADPYPYYYSTSEDDDRLPPELLARHVQQQKPGLVYIVQSAGRIRIGKACSSQRYKSYERSLPHGSELLKVWEVSEPLSWESTLHSRYRQFRIHGSWYEIPDQELKELLSLSPNGEP